jgi:hypothetical protein
MFESLHQVVDRRFRNAVSVFNWTFKLPSQFPKLKSVQLRPRRRNYSQVVKAGHIKLSEQGWRTADVSQAFKVHKIVEVLVQ